MDVRYQLPFLEFEKGQHHELSFLQYHLQERLQNFYQKKVKVGFVRRLKYFLQDDSNYNSETLDDVRCDSTYLPIEHYEKYTKEDIVKKIQYFSANLITDESGSESDESDEWYSDSNFIESFL